jgi:tetratricopeptide (TPR) repeat protein
MIVAEDLLAIGASYRKIGDFENSKSYLNRALDVIPKDQYSEHKDLIAEIYTQIGHLYICHHLHKKEADVADEYYIKALKVLDGFEIYKKELQLNELSKIIGDKNDEIGFRYQYSEYLDSSTYSKFKSPYMLWNFPTKVQKKEIAAIANQQVLPKARNADSSDHCAPNLSKEERLRRLALSGSVRQSGTNSYSVGLKTLSFYSDGGMIFCN